MVKKNILFVMRDSLNGGEAIFSQKLKEGLKKEGFNIKTASLMGDSRNNKNSDTFFLKKVKILGKALPHPNSFKAIKEMSSSSLVSLHFIFDIYSILFFFSSYIKNKNINITFHLNLNTSSLSLKNLRNYLFRIFLINFLTPFAKRIIFLTNAQKGLYLKKCLFKKIFLNKSVVIPNFIEKESILEKKKNINKGDLLNIIFVGRRIRAKGYYDLIKLAKNLENKKIHFNIVGEGKSEPDVSRLDNISLLGSVPNNEILAQYDKNHILLLPSYTEVFPMTILEAMARGLVILSSDFPGIREIIKKGRNGYIFSPGNTKKMEELIIFLKNKPEEIEKISQNNLKDIRNFSEEKQLPKYFKKIR